MKDGLNILKDRLNMEEDRLNSKRWTKPEPMGVLCLDFNIYLLIPTLVREFFVRSVAHKSSPFPRVSAQSQLYPTRASVHRHSKHG